MRQLREGLASGEFWPAMHAAEALTYAGLGTEVREALWPKLPNDADDQHRCGLAREIVRAGDRRALPVLFGVLAKADPYGHTHAAESLYKIAEIGDGRALRKLYQDTPDIRRKLMAAAALARCGNADAHDFIRVHVAHETPEARKIAAWLVTRLDVDLTAAARSPQSAVARSRDALVAKLRERMAAETDVVTRAYQAHALAALGDADGLRQLELNLSHADNEIRTYAAEMVGHVRAASLQAKLIEKLADPWLDVRSRAAQSLLLMAQPAASDVGDFQRDVFVATRANPRYSEGAVAVLDDGRLLYATTEFLDSESDFASARIIARESADGGATWGESRVLQENVGKRNVMSVSLLRPAAATRERHPLTLYYLQKDGFRDLHVFCRDSLDEGRTFGEPRRVTATDGYHVMNNDRVVRLT
ncbi:MAG TPA: HEAT repeat domain-containing protein, partial [Pirellulaceae bacterium]|nr:HEAT repeat domain-containing protein [Pirellulaceae bacterium]